MATYGSTYVDAPVIQPYSFGLLDSVDVKPLSPHEALGTIHESEYCGGASSSYASPCVPPNVAAGTVSISVTESPNRTATLTQAGSPVSIYWVSWGDGTDSVGVTLPATHNYAANGNYLVSIAGQAGYRASVSITVASTAQGPFPGNAFINATKSTRDGTTLVEGKPFTVYQLLTCRTVGELDTFDARARKALELSEGLSVELAFQQIAFAGATDVTPAGNPVDIVDGLAILEQSMNRSYTGQAVIHMGRAAATRLASRAAVLRIGDHLETVLGSLVVAGAGYDPQSGPSAPAATAEWMWATGAVTLRRSDIALVEPVLDNPYTNQFSTLAERQYVTSVECTPQAVEVNQKACCP